MKEIEGRQKEMKENSEAWDQDTDNAEGLLFVAGGEAVTGGATATGHVAGGFVAAAAAGDSGTGAGVGVQSNKTETEMGGIQWKGGPWPKGYKVPGAGRKSRQYERDMLDAVKRVLSPDNIEKYLQTALDLAVEQRSARGIVAVLTLGMAYGAGKPVQQIVADSGKTELLEQLLQGDNGEPLLPDVHEVTSAHE